MAKVKQDYVLQVTAKGLKAVVKEIKALRADIASLGGVSSKASDGMDKISKSSRTADRNIKGAAKATNNSTKSFSKMAQGMSGTLVPAYATVAANVFALTAAFGALSRAADTQILIQAAESLATQTGRSLVSVAKNMKAITGGAISMKEALTSASIAASAGFDNTTIEKLTQVSRNAAIALGRDMTDALNRVFKGAIKAEPELLDELGIILRLDPATRKYAASLGKAVKDLTTFEKQQAVVNEVIAQGEEKFGLLTDVDPNPYAQLAATFNDVANSLITLISIPVAPIFKFLADNVQVLTGALLVFGNSVLKTALPALTKLGEEAQKSISEAASKSALKALNTQALQDFAEKTGDVNKKLSEIRQSAKAFSSTFIDDESAGLGTELYEKLDNQLNRTGDTLSGLKGAYKTVQTAQEEFNKRTDIGTAAYNKQQKALSTVSGALQDSINRIEAAEGVIRSHNQNITKVGLAWENLTTKVGQVKSAGIQGFFTGTSKGIFGLISGFKEFNVQIEKTRSSIAAIGPVTKLASQGIFLLTGAMGAFLKAIPYIGQLIFAFGLLKSAVEFLQSKFRDNNDEIVALSDAYRKNRDSLDTLYKTSLNYKQILDPLPDTIDNITKKLEVQVNIINTMTSELKNLIIQQQALGSFSLADRFLDIFGSGNLGILRDNLDKQIAIIKNTFPEAREELEKLKEAFNITSAEDLATDQVLSFSKALNNLQETLQKTKNAAKESNTVLNETLEQLTKSVTALVSTEKLSDFEQTFISLSSTINQLDPENIIEVASIINNLSDSAQIEFNISGLSEGFADSLRIIEEYSKSIKFIQNDIDNLTAAQLRYIEGAKLSGVPEAVAKTDSAYQELTARILAATNAMELLNKVVDEQKEKLKTLNEEAIAALEKRNAELQILINLDKVYTAQKSKLETEKAIPNKSLLEQISLTKKLTDLELDRVEKLRSEANRKLNIINTTVIDVEKDPKKAATLAADRLRLENELVKTNEKGVELRVKELSELEKILKTTAKREALGVSTGNLTEEVLKRITDRVKEIGALENQTEAQIKRNISAYIAIAEATRLNAELRGKTAESLANENLALQDKIAAFQLESEYLRLNNSLIDERLDKEFLLAETRAKNDLAAVNTSIESGLLTEDELDKAYEKQLQLTLLISNTQLAGLEHIKAQLDQENKKAELILNSKMQEISAGGKITKIQQVQLKLAADIAKLNASGADKASEEYKKQLELLKKIAKADIKLDLQADFEQFETPINKINDIVAEMHERFEALDDPIDRLAAGFVAIGKIGAETGNDQLKAFGALGKAVDDYAIKHKEAGFDGNKILAAQKDLAFEVAGAMTQMFKKGSAGAKAFGAIQASMAVVDGVKAIVASATTLPFPANLVAMATTAAQVGSVLSQIGESVSGPTGGGPSAADVRQDYEDRFSTNGVEGSRLQTNSLRESILSLVDINTELFGVERSLQLSIVQLDKSFKASAAAVFRETGTFSKVDVSEIFGFTAGTRGSSGAFSSTVYTDEILGAGLQLGAAIEFVAGELTGQLVDAFYFLDTSTSKNRTGFRASAWTALNPTQFAELGRGAFEDLNRNLQNTFDTVAGLFDVFGTDLNALFSEFNGLVIDTTKLQLQDLDADARSDVIAQYFSELSNEILKEVIPWLSEYAEGNEELADTLARLNEQTINLNANFMSIGTALDNIIALDTTTIDKAFNSISTAKILISDFGENFINTFSNYSADSPIARSTLVQDLENMIADLGDLEPPETIYRRRTGSIIQSRLDAWEAEIAEQVELYERMIDDLTTGITKNTESFRLSIITAWEKELLKGFKDQDDFNEIFKKFSETIFSADELAIIAEKNARDSLNTGLGILRSQIENAGFNDLALALEDNISAEEFRKVFDKLQNADAFAARIDTVTGAIDNSGADLLSTVIQVGASIGILEDTISELDTEISDFLKDIKRQIDEFGLTGKDLDLLQLRYEFEDVLAEANRIGADISLVEELYGLKRIDIIRSYNQEIVDSIESTERAINSAAINVAQSSEAWDDLAYQSIRVEKLANRLKASFSGFFNLKGLKTFIDFSVFDNTLDTSSFENLFGTILQFEESIPANINDQIELVNELKDAVLDRYNAEAAAIDSLKAVSESIGDYLESLVLSDISPLTNQERLLEAQRQYTDDLAKARAGDETALQNLTTSAQTYLDLADSFYSIGPVFQEIFDTITSDLLSVKGGLDEQVGLTEDALAITTLQADTLNKLNVLDTILDTLNVQNAESFQAEIDAWVNAIGGGEGGTLANIVSKLETLDKTLWETSLQNIPLYDVGTPEVEFDQIAKIHKGEMILTPQTSEEVRSGEAIISNVSNIYNNDSTVLSSGNEEIVNAIRTLTEVLAISQEDLLEQGEKLINKRENTTVFTASKTTGIV